MGDITLREFVRMRLDALGISVEELCCRMGVSSPEALDQILADKAPLSLSQARALAATMDTTIEHICILLYGDD